MSSWADQTIPYEVGEAVYNPGHPATFGRVLDTRPDHAKMGYRDYLVRWKDGREAWVWHLHLNSLERLVADHKKKIETHSKTIRKAKEL